MEVVLTAAVTATDLRLNYGKLEALKGVSFQVNHGEVVVMLGPNGAGKTSAVEVCEGFRKPDSGTVKVLTSDMGDPAVREKVGVMPQEAGWWAVARPLETLRMLAGMYRNPRDPDELLGILQIPAATPWRRLSLGQKQRLSFAMAMIPNPSVLFCDEPTSGMDPAGRADVWEIINSAKQQGCAVVVTSHLLDEAERHADRVVILVDGEVVANAPPSELGEQWAWFRLSSDVPAETLSGVFETVERDGGGYRALGGSLAQLTAVLTDGAEVIEWRSTSLDDLYRRLTKDRA